jgi:putative oxidoreductase
MTSWQIFWPVLATILVAATIIGVVARARVAGWRNFTWRILDFIIAAIFIYAGVLKAIDHYKILPWTIGVGLAFYLPWLEIFCGLALIFRLFYRGALSILTVLVVVFLVATIAAKARGLDITCGCFGHASQNWSFPAHLALDLGILVALAALCYCSVPRARANA